MDQSKQDLVRERSRDRFMLRLFGVGMGERIAGIDGPWMDYSQIDGILRETFGIKGRADSLIRAASGRLLYGSEALESNYFTLEERKPPAGGEYRMKCQTIGWKEMCGAYQKGF